MRRQSMQQPAQRRRRPAFLTLAGLVLAVVAVALALLYQQTRDVHLLLAIAREQGRALMVAACSISPLVAGAVIAAFATTFRAARLVAQVRARRALRALPADREAELADIRARLVERDAPAPGRTESPRASGPDTCSREHLPAEQPTAGPRQAPRRNGSPLDTARLDELAAMFSPADLHDAVSRYLDATGRRIGCIAALAARGARSELGQEARALVGSAGAIGAARLAGLAAELAAACAGGRDAVCLQELAARLDTEAVISARALRSWLEESLAKAA